MAVAVYNTDRDSLSLLVRESSSNNEVVVDTIQSLVLAPVT